MFLFKCIWEDSAQQLVSRVLLFWWIKSWFDNLNFCNLASKHLFSWAFTCKYPGCRRSSFLQSEVTSHSFDLNPRWSDWSSKLWKFESFVNLLILPCRNDATNAESGHPMHTDTVLYYSFLWSAGWVYYFIFRQRTSSFEVLYGVYLALLKGESLAEWSLSMFSQQASRVSHWTWQPSFCTIVPLLLSSTTRRGIVFFPTHLTWLWTCHTFPGLEISQVVSTDFAGWPSAAATSRKEPSSQKVLLFSTLAALPV